MVITRIISSLKCEFKTSLKPEFKQYHWGQLFKYAYLLGEKIKSLIKSEDIALALEFRSIGTLLDYSFVIKSENGDIQDIWQTLLQLPHSYLFWNKHTLAGRVKIPPDWFYKVLDLLTKIDRMKGSRILLKS